MKVATIEDLKRFIQPARWFFEKTKIAGVFKPDVFIKHWESLLELKYGTVFFSERDGRVSEAIGIVVGDSMFDGEPIASIAFWFVQEERTDLGVALMFNRLLQTLQSWKIKRINVSALYSFHFAETSVFLEKAGFVAKEAYFQREI